MRKKAADVSAAGVVYLMFSCTVLSISLIAPRDSCPGAEPLPAVANTASLPAGSATAQFVESVSGGMSLDYMDAKGVVGKVDRNYVNSLHERHALLEDIDWTSI